MRSNTAAKMSCPQARMLLVTISTSTVLAAATEEAESFLKT